MKLDYERRRRAAAPDWDWIVVLVGVAAFPLVFCVVSGWFIRWFGP